MSDGTALLRAICEQPGEDTPRLVYADWLDEQGDRESRDRAEFIRVQIRIHGLQIEERGGFDVFGDLYCRKCVEPTGWYEYTKRCRGEACRLRQREYYSSRQYVVWDWCRGIPIGPRPVYTRGFVSGIKLTCADFLTHAVAIFAAHPVTSVRLTDSVAFEDQAGCHWDCEGDNGGPYVVPRVIYQHLKGSLENDRAEECTGYPYTVEDENGIVVGYGLRYLTRDRADTALSRACVAHGRTLAGLTARRKSREPGKGAAPTLAPLMGD